jgi:hypothetical protein
MHAYDRRGLHRMSAIDVFEMDHGEALVRIALTARLDTRLAADAPRGINEELHVSGDGHKMIDS